ncbi:MAG: hypothetical protein C5B59_06585 [Bacteroidetes bacterium]|nr:MAG: hypothetical protein C5B59_06585 [Bacteroidota bacterium]
MNEERIAKLPIWAQEHIEVLDRRLKSMTTQRDQAMEAMAGQSTSDVYVAGHGASPDMPLPNYRDIEFKTNDPHTNISVCHSTDGRGNVVRDKITIRTSFRGMRIIPVCSNVVEIQIEER